MTIYWQGGAARAAADVPVSEAERAARVQLAAAYRIFDHLGWTEMIFNHITLRVPGEERRFPVDCFDFQVVNQSGVARERERQGAFGPHQQVGLGFLDQLVGEL